MSLKASYEHRVFHFKRPSGTSRGVLTEKHSWFISIWHDSNPEVKGIGECSIIEGLSPDFIDEKTYESKLKDVCANPEQDLNKYPSIKFGVESALLDLKNGGKQIYFNNSFTRGEQLIPINGLIWMGEPEFMSSQIQEKIDDGFTTIKMKIAAINFSDEYDILNSIRKQYAPDQITLRVDANGGFNNKEALELLKKLEGLNIHSIEQPIKAGQWSEMSKLCEASPVPIALDEELIGIQDEAKKRLLLTTIRPDYIILKPSLHGGISGTQEWIRLAEDLCIKWWMTSALESNIGLNVICQLTAEYKNGLPQGLGTGSLYTDNIPTKLHVDSGFIQLLKEG